MKVRHVWLIPPMGVGETKPGLVLTWRRRVQQASPPTWEAYVVFVDERREDVRVEWVPSVYLVPARSEKPPAGR